MWKVHMGWGPWLAIIPVRSRRDRAHSAQQKSGSERHTGSGCQGDCQEDLPACYGSPLAPPSGACDRILEVSPERTHPHLHHKTSRDTDGLCSQDATEGGPSALKWLGWRSPNTVAKGRRTGRCACQAFGTRTGMSPGVGGGGRVSETGPDLLLRCKIMGFIVLLNCWGQAGSWQGILPSCLRYTVEEERGEDPQGDSEREHSTSIMLPGRRLH